MFVCSGATSKELSSELIGSTLFQVGVAAALLTWQGMPGNGEEQRLQICATSLSLVAASDYMQWLVQFIFMCQCCSGCSVHATVSLRSHPQLLPMHMPLCNCFQCTAAVGINFAGSAGAAVRR
jgi:hypothetical protein